MSEGFSRGRSWVDGRKTSIDAARRWSKAHSSATAGRLGPPDFAPGEAYQFDWSLEIVVLNGVTTTVKVAHVRLCYSRMMFARAYPRETQEMVFDAHERPSRFSGAPAGAASTTT
jgi:hypothetical protein